MDDDERRGAEEQLALWEWVLAAQERRHEVIDVVWDAADRQEGGERIRELLGLEGGDPLVVLDMSMAALTREGRDHLAHRVSEIRERLGLA